LNITSARDHKNLGIAIDIAQLLQKNNPGLRLRFVYTIRPDEFPPIPENLKDYFCFTGKVSIEECPSLYEQCDIAFQPTLLECFTATYPEAMVMKKPIVTTDLGFARALCGNAALYYSPLSAEDAYSKILEIVYNKEKREELIKCSDKELEKFDNNKQRAEKLIEGCVMLFKN
jgi:glycosyltransferase involved in cell wall biosynthesis